MVVVRENGAMRTRMSVEELTARIRSGIVRGSPPVGSWLRQEALAVRYGVSRTPIREALRQLEAGGLVTLVPRRGALVRGLTPKEIRDTYRVRAELDGLAAEMACGRIDTAGLRRLRSAEVQFAESGPALAAWLIGDTEVPLGARWVAANDAFHDAVRSAAGNLRLTRVIADLESSIQRSLTSAPLAAEPGHFAQNVAEHALIRATIERRDPVRARRAAYDHVMTAGEHVANWWEEQNPAVLATAARD